MKAKSYVYELFQKTLGMAHLTDKQHMNGDCDRDIWNKWFYGWQLQTIGFFARSESAKSER